MQSQDNGSYQYKNVYKILGYPKSDLYLDDVSPYGQTGFVQEFDNGDLYKYENDSFSSSYLIYGGWKDKFDDMGGINSVGYPKTDAGYNSLTEDFTQTFEKFMFSWNSGNVSALERDFSVKVSNGLGGYIDDFHVGIVGVQYIINTRVLANFDSFLSGVDNAQDTETNRTHYCRLYNSEIINSFDHTALKTDAICEFSPSTIDFYRSNKSLVEDKRTLLLSKMQEQAKQQQEQYQKKEGEVTIDKNQKSSNHSNKKDIGDYVDFEEVDD